MIGNNDLRILIIDDNPIIHQDFIKILTTTQNANELNKLDSALFGEDVSPTVSLPLFEIDTATQGQEGVVRIQQALDENRAYAVAFVDVRMPPGWNGIETIQHIWQIDPNIQIVICTAYSDYTWEETVEQLGITDNLLILKKPFDNVTVRQLASALIKKWQLMRESRQRTELLESTITKRTQSLQESLSLIRATIESSNDAILVVNKEGKLVDYNYRFCSMLNVSPETIQSMNEKIIFEYIKDQLKSPEGFIESTVSIDNNNEVSIDTLTFKDGRVIERYSQPHILNNKTIGRVWSFRDITKRFYLEKQLEHQAYHDPLTDLPNRILLEDRLKHAISSASKNKTKLGILFIDIDRFKLINDSLGHEAGDQLLIAVANRLKSNLREADTIARLGGDEFVVLSNIADNKQELTIANKILDTFKTSFKIGDRLLNITSSIGISIYPDNGDTIEDLIRNADLAMYQAKEKGMNQIHMYMNDMKQNPLNILELETQLRQALLNEEFFLTYQAQYDSYSGKIIGAEVLIRWNHPERGVLLPIDFIIQAEASGLILDIGKWVLETACKQCKSWIEEGLTPIRIAINVAYLQFKQPDFFETVKNTLETTKLDPEYLEIEVTENVVLSSLDLIDTIEKIRSLGVKIALDDFGACNSSLGYLRDVTVDRLKIDKSFIQNIESNRNDEIIIKSIIALAHSMEMEVVAEGVETKKQLDFLKKEACYDIQGFYFSNPLPAGKFKELLIQNVTVDQSINKH